MQSDGPETLEDAIRRIDARLRALSNFGIDLSRPGRRLLEDLRARRDEMRQRHAALEATRQEADRWLPELLERYTNGGDADRQWVRGLLRRCPSFCWGFGWGLDNRIATAEDARRALAVLSMKDADSDYRDQIVALDHLGAAMRRAGLPAPELLAEAAAWSSDVARFPPARSTRALLLHYAQRFGG
jgi:hypothetical protein